MVTRKCDRKIPTVSVKSNYKVEGNFKIDGSLIVNGNDISSLKPTSLNGVSGDVVLSGGNGINIEKSGKTITISSSFDGINALRFVYCDKKPSVEDAVRDTVYLVEKSLNFEAWMLSSDGKELKNLSSAFQDNSGEVSGGLLEAIENKFDVVEKDIEDVKIIVEEQKDSISVINSSITGINSDISDIKGAVDEIKDDIEASETKIAEIQEQLNDIDHESFVTFKIVESTEEVERDAKSNVIYLIKSGDVYEEYIYVDEKAEIIGGVSNDVDMSQYVTIEELESKNYLTDESLTSINESLVNIDESINNNTQIISNLTGTVEELSSKIDGEDGLSSSIESFGDRIDETEKTIEEIKDVTDNIDKTIETKIEEAKTDILSQINNITFQPVEKLPSEEEANQNVIYLVPNTESSDSNVKDEYIFIDGKFEKIGDSKVDLSGYVTEDFLEESQKDFVKSDVLSDYATKESLDELSGSVEDIQNAGYITSSALDDYTTTEDLENTYAKSTDLEEYAKTSELEEYAKSTDLEDYAKTSELEGYAKSTDLEEYAKSTDLEGYVSADNLQTEVADILKEFGIIDDNEEIIPPPDSGPDTPSTDGIDQATKDLISEVFEEKLQEKNFLNRGKNGYMTLSELIDAYESLELNTIYWVKDKSSIEQYIKNEDNKLMQISGNLNVKLSKPEDINMWELPWSSDCVEFTDNLPELVDGSYLFQNCVDLESFVSDASNMTTAIDMFKGCSKLTNFNSQLFGLRKASGMFEGCKLSLESIENLIYSLEGKLPTGEEGEFEITIGFEMSEDDEQSLITLDEEAREKGWTVTWLRHGTEEVTFE